MGINTERSVKKDNLLNLAGSGRPKNPKRFHYVQVNSLQGNN